MSRRLAVAFVAATVVALVVDAALQLALDAVRVSDAGGAPWWITANLVSRGRWVALAGIVWWLAPRLAPPDVWGRPDEADPAHAEATWGVVGVAVLAVPLLWVLATWLVTSVRFTVLGSWATDGRVFLAPEYYRGIALDYVPWLMAGLAVRAIGRHI